MCNNDIFILKALRFSDTFIVQLASVPWHYATFLFIALYCVEILSKLFHLISRSKKNRLT